MPWATSNLMNKRAEFASRAMRTENFRAFMSRVWDQRTSGLQMAGALSGRRSLRDEGAESTTAWLSSPAEGGRDLRDRADQRTAPALGSAEDSGSLPAPTWAGPSESSFKRVLERCGLTQKRQVRAPKQTGRIASGRKASAPNQVWTGDFKGWWYDREGRCEPLTVRDEYSR
jgi:hypothetical protein